MRMQSLPESRHLSTYRRPIGRICSKTGIGHGKVRLRSAHDLDADRCRRAAERVSEWEIRLRLAERLRQSSEATVELMAVVRDRVELSTVKELSHLLFSIGDRRGRTDIALLLNGLGTSWPDVESAAMRLRSGGSAYAQELLVPSDG